jgi:eukaryotic-like serine/threonine-protein kinase
VPFTGDTPVEIAMKHLSHVPEPPSKLRSDVPHDLDAVVMRALAKDPDQRYGSAEEMDADLARVARGVAVSRETEEAMTQVLSGAGETASQTMVTRPRTLATPPIPPAYRTPYYDYEDTPARRSFLPWLLAALLVVAAAAGGWFLYTKIQEQLNDSKPVAVPDVTRLQKDLARTKIEEVGLTARFQYLPDETVPVGQVSSQNPGPGTKISKTSTVTLVVSTGIPNVTVPGVVGQDVTSAVAALAQAGLEQKIKRIYSGQQEDTVTGQNPAAGDHVKKGSTVTINVSRGPKPVTLPDVTGVPYLQAESVLRGQGFTVSRVDVQSDQQPKGVVVSMDPPQGTDVPAGSKITLSVSSGPATSQIPDVTNQTQADASRILKAAGFTVGLVMEPVTDPSQDGIVVSQDPVGGSTGQQGEVVVITVGQLQPAGAGGNQGGNQNAVPPTTPTTTTGVTTTQTTTTLP